MKTLILGTALVLSVPIAAQARSFSTVDVSGNEFVASEDIITACQIETGVDLAGADLLGIRECLLDSGLFGSVGLLIDGETLHVVVDEINDRPGRVELGIEYDSRDGVLATLYFERYNLFPGTFGAVELTFSEEVRSLRTSLYHADLRENLGAGIDATYRRTNFDDQGFTAERATIEPYLAWRLSPASRMEVGIGYRRDEVSDIDTGASALFWNDIGTERGAYARLGLRLANTPEGIEDRDAPRLSLRVDQYVWNIGTDDRVAELRARADAAFALTDRLDLLVGVAAGAVKSLDDGPTRTTDRFFVGGSDFRGFAARGLGPKDGDYFVGANRYTIASVELQTPVPVFNQDAKLGVFADAGSAWGLDDTLGGRIDDSRNARSAVGLSLTFDIDSAPLSLFIAKPTRKEPGDDEENFGLTFNSSF